MSDFELLGQALSLMKEALGLLDQAEAAADVGAHLDLAIHRLEDTLRPVHKAVSAMGRS